MRNYTVSLKGEESKVLNFRGAIIVLKEGDIHSSDSEIYKFFSKYFEPTEYYNKNKVIEPVITEITKSEEKPKKQTKKKNSLEEFNVINNNENDVIIETSNQE